MPHKHVAGVEKKVCRTQADPGCELLWYPEGLQADGDQEASRAGCTPAPFLSPSPPVALSRVLLLYCDVRQPETAQSRKHAPFSSPKNVRRAQRTCSSRPCGPYYYCKTAITAQRASEKRVAPPTRPPPTPPPTLIKISNQHEPFQHKRPASHHSAPVSSVVPRMRIK